MSETATVMTTIAAPAAEIPDGEAPAAEIPSAAPEPTPEPGEDARLQASMRLHHAAERESRSRKIAREAEAARTEVASMRAEFAKERDAFRAELDSFRSDPVAYELKAGRDPIEAVKRFATPETETERAIRDLREQLAARDRAEEERTSSRKAEAEQQRSDRILSSFVSGITAEECPNLVATVPAHKVPAMVGEMLNEEYGPNKTLLEAFQEEHGRNPTDQELRAALEHRAAERAKTLYESLKGVYAPIAEPLDRGPSASTRGPSLSNNNAGSLESSPPANGEYLSLEERRAKSLREIKDQLEAGD